MFRLLSLLTLCSVALVPTIVSAQETKRTVFTYKNEQGTGTFKLVGGVAWVEMCPNGDKFEFKEVMRNAEFIHIYDAKRKVGVRLYADKSMWREPKDTKGKWVMLWEGKWTE